jgi:hypothetical protein
MALFEIKPEPRRSLLSITLSGYWDKATFDAYAEAVRMALRRMKVQGGCRHCLVDATGFAVQSAEITKALQALTDSFPADCPERIAGITGSKLSELQARHAGESSSRRVFATREAAEAWLFSKNA